MGKHSAPATGDEEWDEFCALMDRIEHHLLTATFIVIIAAILILLFGTEGF